MVTAAAARGRPVGGVRAKQRGQALIYGIFVMLASLATLFFLFNTGQLAREKTKLVNTADAVAYSAGVLHARALNFEAYTNRAMVANTVAIAQMVSVSSWNNMVWQEAQSSKKNSPNVGEVAWASIVSNPIHGAAYNYPYYLKYYEASVVPITKLSSKSISSAADTMIDAVLRPAENYMRATLVLNRTALLTQVAAANYKGDGTVKVDLLSGLSDEYVNYSKGMGFIRPYSGAQRTRFAEVAVAAAKQDGFVRERRWSTTAPVPYDPNCLAVWELRKPELRKRGTTELVGLDEWKAVDTYSLQRWKTKKTWGIVTGCKSVEKPVAWGGQIAAKDVAFDKFTYGNASKDTPKAFANANGGFFFSLFSVLASTSVKGAVPATPLNKNRWSGYAGLPSFDDLSAPALASSDPRLHFAVRLVRSKAETMTSSGKSQIKTEGKLLPQLDGDLAKNEMGAVSTSVVFFARPQRYEKNTYGAGMGKPNEIGSLFNPYWDAKLDETGPADINQARLLQGS